MPRCMAQDLEASRSNHIAPRTAVNSKFRCVATVWRLDWDAKSGFALRSIQRIRIDRAKPRSYPVVGLALLAIDQQPL